jgi:O-antigen ligase
MKKDHRLILILLAFFILWITVTTIFSDLSLTDVFYGAFGRNNGILTYCMLVIFMSATIFVSNDSFIKSLLLILITVGFFSAIYGTIQFLGKDPFGWISDNVIVFGFFGNPNFQASFMGISATVAFSYVMHQKNQLWLKLSFVAFIMLALFIVYQSKSQQGYLVFLVGISVVTYLWLTHHLIFKKLRIFYIFGLGLGVVFVILDVFQRSPWDPFLYKESVSYRGDFWKAGWNMTLGNPFFGVGLDGYRDNYRLYRDQIAANRNPGSFVDSAHNLLLDLSSGGGFPLVIIYLALVMITLSSARKIIKRSNAFDYNFAALLGAWVAYTSQSLISIQQIGLAVWGWVLAGAIIGYEINGRQSEQVKLPNRDALNVLAVGGGLVIGLIISLPPFITDAQFRSSVLSGEVTKIESALQRWPQNVSHVNFASDLFRKGGFPEQALNMARKAVALNPRNFEAWQQIFLSQNAPDAERKAALLKMRELDPFNQTLK